MTYRSAAVWLCCSGWLKLAGVSTCSAAPLSCSCLRSSNSGESYIRTNISIYFTNSGWKLLQTKEINSINDYGIWKIGQKSKSFKLIQFFHFWLSVPQICWVLHTACYTPINKLLVLYKNTTIYNNGLDVSRPCMTFWFVNLTSKLRVMKRLRNTV